jgi:hypothetical protein
MASRRSLGGGRVLGSGKGLAPPAPAPATPTPSQQVPKQVQATRNTGLLSPSESSVSLNSQASSTPISTDHEDLTSRIALDEHGSAQAAAAASSRMVCPICNEEMVCRIHNTIRTHTILTCPGHTATAKQVGTEVRKSSAPPRACLTSL